MKIYTASKEHIEAKNRQRRVIIRLDALGEHIMHMRNLSEEDYFSYLFGLLDKDGHQVDCIFWDIMYGADFAPMYDSKILSARNKYIDKLGKGVDFFGEILKESKRRNYENFIVNRISEVILQGPIPEIFYEHPEYFIRSWNDLGGFNLACKEVRDYKISIIEEVLCLYDFDGIDIDFARHTPFLEPGKQWALRNNVTEYLRGLRNMTLALENKTNRPVLLSARVPCSVELANADGIDIAQIADEDLVDILTLGSRSLDVDVEGYRKVVGNKIKLYPCYDGEHASDGYMYPSIEIMRGVFSSWWHKGADGVQTFNWRTDSDNARKRIFSKYDYPYVEPDCMQEQAYKEIGDYDKMISRDKTFVVERRGGYPWGEGLSYNHQTKQLPLTMCNHGGKKEVTIYSSDDISNKSDRNATLSLVLYGLAEGETVGVDFDKTNLQALRYNYSYNEAQIWAPEPAPTSGGTVRNRIEKGPPPQRKLLKVDFAVPNELLHSGMHILKVHVSRKEHDRNISSFVVFNTVTLEKAELHIRIIHCCPK